MTTNTVEIPIIWLDTLLELFARAEESLQEFNLDGSSAYNRRAVEFMYSGVRGHLKSMSWYDQDNDAASPLEQDQE